MKTNITANDIFHKFMEEVRGKDIVGKELYEQYAICKSAIKILSEHAEEINNLILEEMTNLGVDKQEFDFGKFTRGSRISWEYNSPELYEKEKDIKKLKKELEENGTATKTEKNYLLLK